MFPSVDFSARDAPATLASFGLLTTRRGLPVELCQTYWRDAHGLIAARIPGIFQYWQHHLGKPDAGLWPRLDGIECGCPPEDEFQGVSEGTFRSEEDRHRFGTHPAIALIAADEQNLFSRVAIYQSKAGNSRTFVDRLAEGGPIGRSRELRLLVFLKSRAEVPSTAFSAFLRERFAPALAASPLVSRVRLHLFEPYDAAAWNTPNVAHDQSEAQQYQAMLELVFADRLAARRFLASADYQATATEQPRFLHTVHVFPEPASYTMVAEGQLTVAGRRGGTSAETILAVGAFNQLEPETVRFIDGAGGR